MTIRCVECDREIPAADVNLDTALAKCTACNAVFGIMDQVQGTTVALPASGPRPIVSQPDRFTVEDSGGSLRISFRWFSPLAFFLLFFCIFWNAFLVVWYVIAFSTNGPLMMKLFPLIHVAVGLFLTYYVLTSFLNRTTITVGEGACRVKHGPLPWPGNCELFSDDVEQIHVEEKTRVNNRRLTYYYDVFARMRDGAKVKLVASLTDADQARFVEQEIERFLRIRDEPVPGEYRR